MGTWGEGILENDSALDGLGDIAGTIQENLTELASASASAETAGRLAAAVGLLLLFSEFSFEDEDEFAGIKAVLDAHAETCAGHLSAEAAKVLSEIRAGNASAYLDREAPIAPELRKALGSKVGLREDCLFESKAALAYLEQVVTNCVELLEEDFEDEDSWEDLCREAMSIGALAALLSLRPAQAPRPRLLHWRRCAAEGLTRLEAEEDEELHFQRLYYANLDRVFAALLGFHE